MGSDGIEVHRHWAQCMHHDPARWSCVTRRRFREYKTRHPVEQRLGRRNRDEYSYTVYNDIYKENQLLHHKKFTWKVFLFLFIIIMMIIMFIIIMIRLNSYAYIISDYAQISTHLLLIIRYPPFESQVKIHILYSINILCKNFPFASK